MAEKQKVLPTVIYLAVGIVGLLSLFGLITGSSFAFSVANISAWLLAIGAVNWGVVKFINPNLNLVEKVGFF